MRDAGDPSDAALVAAVRAGDKEAFVVLLGRHRALLHALCRRVLGDSALVEDALQEAILQALLGLDRLRGPEQFGSWLGGIGLNVCRRLLSERARGVVSWDELCGGRYRAEPVDWRVGPAELAEQADLGRRVRDAIAALPHGQRSAVALFYLSGLTQAETAAQLGIDPGAVKTRLHKARRTLRQRLQAEWEEWGERYVPDTSQNTLVRVQVESVRKNMANDTRVMVLEEVEGPRYLLIWIGEDVAFAISTALEKSELTRPLTHILMGQLLDALDGRLREVRVTRLVEDVYYADLVVEGPKRTVTLDARPSDAVALALIADAPIYVEDAVLDVAGVVVEHDGKTLRRVEDGSLAFTTEVDASGKVVRRAPHNKWFEEEGTIAKQSASEPGTEQDEGR